MQILKDYLLKAEDFLRKKNIEKPRLEAQLLFSHVLGLSRIHLYTSEDLPLKKTEVDKLRDLLMKKVNGTPTAYLVGEKEFFSLSFEVNNNVLIPRPETEELVELVIAEEKERSFQLVADLCTGSGCLGVALAKSLPISHILLSDISGEALEVAERNFAKHLNQSETSFTACKSDLTEEWPGDFVGRFELIVSNPPYVTSAEYEQLMPQVKNFEPRLALLVENTSEFFSRLFEQVYRNLQPGGKFYFETNPNLVAKQIEMLAKAEFNSIEAFLDLSKKERFICAKKE